MLCFSKRVPRKPKHLPGASWRRISTKILGTQSNDKKQQNRENSTESEHAQQTRLRRGAALRTAAAGVPIVSM
jgi:hypothetical protein